MGGALLSPLLLPGLLAAGIGTLVFVGLDSWTGFGTFSLAIPHLPAFTSPTVAEFAWAIAIGVAAAAVGAVIKPVALRLQDVVERRAILLTVVMGVVVALVAMLYAALTPHSSSLVLFSGQNQLPSLVETAGTFSVGALVLLVICKGIAYTASLSGFRGGPIFPSMFIGAAAGIALSHLPGLPMVAGVAMGIGAMTAVMLGLPLTAVLLTSVFMAADGLALVPLVIVAVCVAYVASAHLTPVPPEEPPAPRRLLRPPEADLRKEIPWPSSTRRRKGSPRPPLWSSTSPPPSAPRTAAPRARSAPARATRASSSRPTATRSRSSRSRRRPAYRSSSRSATAGCSPRRSRSTAAPRRSWRTTSRAMPRAGLRAQLCGDAHLSNFGGFASPERKLVFDLNDFDETLPGPFEWDVKRLAASFEIAGRDRDFTDAERARAVLDARPLVPRLRCASFARGANLDVWYARLDVETIERNLREQQAKRQAATGRRRPRRHAPRTA